MTTLTLNTKPFQFALCLLSAALLSWTPVASANPELAKTKNCASCHSPEKAILGPSYQAVAQKYANDKNAQAKLTEKVMGGGVGVWGKIPMPANPQVSKDEADTLVKWILSQK
jgi:cytochrome c